MFSHCAANALVGNTSNASTLEITFAGPVLKFSVASTIALVGAKAEVTLDGEEIEAGASIHVTADQVLRFGLMRTGARTYLAVRGGIDVPQVMGSRSTYVLSRIGGLDGRVLRAGDRLTIGDEIRPESSGRGGATLPAEYISEPKRNRNSGLCQGCAITVSPSPGWSHSSAVLIEFPQRQTEPVIDFPGSILNLLTAKLLSEQGMTQVTW